MVHDGYFCVPREGRGKGRGNARVGVCNGCDGERIDKKVGTQPSLKHEKDMHESLAQEAANATNWLFEVCYPSGATLQRASLRVQPLMKQTPLPLRESRP